MPRDLRLTPLIDPCWNPALNQSHGKLGLNPGSKGGAHQLADAEHTQPSIKLIFNNGEVYLIGGKKNNFTKVKYYFFDGVNRVFSKDNFTKLISYELKKNRYQLKETVQIKKKNYQTDVYEKIFNYSIKNHIEKINQSGLKLLVLYKKILNSYNRAYGK